MIKRTCKRCKKVYDFDKDNMYLVEEKEYCQDCIILNSKLEKLSK